MLRLGRKFFGFGLIFLPLSFLVFTTIFVIFLSFWGFKNSSIPVAAASPAIYSANPPTLGLSSQEIGYGSARGIILEQYFASQNCPLAPYGQAMIVASEKYGLPWTLLPAIAMQESSGGKSIPEGTYNPFGWAITETQTFHFSGWEEAIDRVGRSLREDFLDEGLVTPSEIMTKYCPLSIPKGGPWAKGVEFFTSEILEFTTPLP